ncbi:MAG: extracellular solute-binding protein [Clostridia bacterium]|nr:extracellular solute-binding protein [Clostridia bacterium]
MKRIRQLGAAALIIAFCAGCSGVPPEEISAREVSIIKIIKPNYIPDFSGIVNEFSEINSDLQVRFVDAPLSTGERHQLYVSALSGKDESIDLYWVNDEWTEEFAKEGYILPIDNEIPTDGGSYIIDAKEMFSYNNGLYALPIGLDMDFVFFRKDMIKQSPENWDEIIAECRRSDLQLPLALCVENSDAKDMLCNIAEIKNSKGCSYSEALNIYKEIISDNIDADNMPIDYVSVFKTGNASMLIGNAAFWRKLNHNTSAVRGNVDMGRLPGEESSYIRGYGLAVNINSKNKEAALRFLDFMNSKKSQENLSRECSVMPVIESLYDDDMIIDANPYIKNIKDIVKNTPAYKNLKISGEELKQAEEAIIKYFNNEETAENTGRTLEILLTKRKEN